MKNKGFYLLLVIFAIMFLADVITTNMNDNLAPYLETNPVYQFGGFLLIDGLNIVFMLLIWWTYTNKRTSPFIRYFILMYMLIIVLWRISTVSTNFYMAQHPPTLEQAQSLTQEFKTNYYKKELIINFSPIIPTFLTYLFFRLDHEVKRK